MLYLMTSKELKAWRTRTGYSQGKLAKVLGVIPLTISRWEREEREIPSFLHLALKCVELKGGEIETKRATKTKKKRR
jgi:transcriptional regulator with XRE-family HTH domain